MLTEYINLFLSMPFIVHRDFIIKVSAFASGQILKYGGFKHHLITQ